MSVDFKEMLKKFSAPKDEKDYYVLLANDQCPACVLVKETLEERKELGQLDYKEVDVLSDEGMKMAERLNVKAVPKLLKLQGLRLVDEPLEYDSEKENE